MRDTTPRVALRPSHSCIHSERVRVSAAAAEPPTSHSPSRPSTSSTKMSTTWPAAASLRASEKTAATLRSLSPHQRLWMAEPGTLSNTAPMRRANACMRMPRRVTAGTTEIAGMQYDAPARDTIQSMCGPHLCEHGLAGARRPVQQDATAARQHARATHSLEVTRKARVQLELAQQPVQPRNVAEIRVQIAWHVQAVHEVRLVRREPEALGLWKVEPLVQRSGCGGGVGVEGRSAQRPTYVKAQRGCGARHSKLQG